MPVNAGIDYANAQRKYLEARNVDEKIKALEEMIRTLPKHKGTENLLAQLHGRMTKLKTEREKQRKKSRKTFNIRKVGAARVCILGPPNSGKSMLLKKLTGVGIPSECPYSTKKPFIGMMTLSGAQIQMIEIPSSFKPSFLSITRSSNLNICLIDMNKYNRQRKEMKKIIEKEGLKNIIWVGNKNDLIKEKHEDVFLISAKTGENIDDLKDIIWKSLKLIRIYTKSINKEKQDKPVVLPEGSRIMDLARNIHEDMIKFFMFARVWGSTKFPGERVGLKYILKDKDIVEIHTK